MTNEKSLFRVVDDRPNPHIKWLREVASTLHAERRTALANTCEGAAKELESIIEHRNALLIAHERRAAEPNGDVERLQKAITSAMEALSNGRIEDGARILRECFWLGERQ